jgi:hypothetical protein
MLIPTLMLALMTAGTPSANPDVLLPIRAAAVKAAARADEPDALARAIAAQAAGDFITARREYVIAAAIDRDAGTLPTQASYGLALILSEQGKYRPAAQVMEHLAADAATLQDDETEARALIDALYLNSRAHFVAQARDNAERLRVLAKSAKVSPSTRKMIATL